MILTRRVSLKMEEDLYDGLLRLAEREERSLNNLILHLLRQAVKEKAPQRRAYPKKER